MSCRRLEDMKQYRVKRLMFKSVIFLVHTKLPSQCVARVRRVTGFGLKSFSVRYLGCLLFAGRRKDLYSMELVQSVINKISSWRSRFLFNGGRLMLIKHVLSTVSIHLLAASCPPKGVLALAEWPMANFLCGEREGGLRHHWIKWKDLCVDSSQGGWCSFVTGCPFSILAQIMVAVPYK